MMTDAQTMSPPEKVSLPPASLIICTRNRPTLLRDTIDSILQGESVPREIIIIDQSDQPDTALEGIARAGCEIGYRWVEWVGLSRGRNTAMGIARYDLLVFTDDDVLVEPSWFRTLVEAAVTAGPQTIVTGQVRPADPAPAPDMFVPSTKVDPERTVYTGRQFEGALFPLNMAMSRTVFDTVGPFDERLGGGTTYRGAEDTDLAFRVLQAGMRILYEPSAVVYHRGWRTRREAIPLRWNYGVGRGAFYAKHITRQDRSMLRRMLVDVKNHLVSFLVHLRPERERAYRDGVLGIGILYGAGRWLLTPQKR